MGISGYPESHHFISDETTIEAMFEKEPMATYIVSQICFDAEVIRTWIRRVRERGTFLPIWIGVPGAVETRKLLRTSLRIGLGQSVRFLRGQRGMLRRFLGPRTYTPTELLVALAPTFADEAARVGGIHVYTFNEIERNRDLAATADRPPDKRQGGPLAQVNENPGIMLYSRIRKSPYFYASRRHGVQLYSVYNHMYHPRHYGDPVEEYWHLLNGVTLWDVGVERQIEISGPDAFEFTNLLVARDLNKCAVEQCKYVFLCLPDGGIINDPVLLRVEENRFWLSLADSDVELWARGVAYNSGHDVTIKELDVGPVQVQGPKSKDVMVDLFGDSILDIPYYYLRPYELDGMKVLVSRTGYTSELGFEIYLYEASARTA